MWHDQCKWAQYNTSTSNDNVMKVLTKSECCFCLISVAKEFDVPEFRTGHGRQVSQTTSTRWRQVTICVGLEIALFSRTRGEFNPPRFALHRVRAETEQQVSHFTECAEGSIKDLHSSPSTRDFRHGFALSRVRGFLSFRSR